jgi:ABC-2 type transport system ATP-binding protein
MDDIAIKIEHINKTFKLPHDKQNSVKGGLISLFKGGKRTYEKQQVLKDISFEIKKGEFFGIVGRNGSGKSTLLKMLAGIYAPTQGNIHVNGKLTPFIELGVGFNPELTGRENVFLNGALLGFNRTEMAAMYDDIVAFAEIEKFMDQKLKNYSSGMQVRLAFSIAIQARSDILVLDEVLAVGDEAFQKKCIAVFDEYKKNKQTVILVTHDMQTVKKYCNRAILINQGEIIEEGSPQKVANEYSKLNEQDLQNGHVDEKSDIQLTLSKPNTGSSYQYGEELTVNVTWDTQKPVDTVGVAMYSSIGEIIYAANTDLDGKKLNGSKAVTYKVKLTIGAGNYFLMAGTFVGKSHNVVDFNSQGPKFSVKDTELIKGEGLARLEHVWEA